MVPCPCPAAARPAALGSLHQFRHCLLFLGLNFTKAKFVHHSEFKVTQSDAGLVRRQCRLALCHSAPIQIINIALHSSAPITPGPRGSPSANRLPAVIERMLNP